MPTHSPVVAIVIMKLPNIKDRVGVAWFQSDTEVVIFDNVVAPTRCTHWETGGEKEVARWRDGGKNSPLFPEAEELSPEKVKVHILVPGGLLCRGGRRQDDWVTSRAVLSTSARPVC